MLKDIGIGVPKSMNTRCNMQTKAGDDNMLTITCVTTSVNAKKGLHMSLQLLYAIIL